MNSSFLHMLTRFHSTHRPIINVRFRLKNVFRLTFRYYFIVILVYSVSLARLGTSFIYMWIKRELQNRALI